MLECHAGRAGMGLLDERCPAPCPLSFSLAEGPWAASLRGRFGFPAEGGLDLYRGFCLSPAVERSWNLAQPAQALPAPGSGMAGLFAVSWGGQDLALPHSLSLQNT